MIPSSYMVTYLDLSLVVSVVYRYITAEDCARIVPMWFMLPTSWLEPQRHEKLQSDQGGVRGAVRSSPKVAEAA